MLFSKFYLDKEKDIIVNLYKEKEDEIKYIIETPNHNTGNLITNLSKIFNLETVKDKKDMKIISGILEANIDGANRVVYILRLGGIKIANIYEDGEISIKAKIPAITKTLMSQTKQYNLPIEKTIVKSYILKKSKFRTDLHTHMNANLSPDVLIALGIKHQIKYPLYYIKKLKLKLTENQNIEILEKRKLVEETMELSGYTEKEATRKIDDNTYVNFTELILENIEDAEYNIAKIRKSLAILKDGQAVFTNLEKVYIYRYVFCKGKTSEHKVELTKSSIELIPENEIKEKLLIMLEDMKNIQIKENDLRKDKLLWIAREYSKQGIEYAEITDTELAKTGGAAINYISDIHEIMPYIEKETGVKLRFLVGLRRIPLTILKDQIAEGNYLRENIDTLKTVAKSPYVVGSDFIGEEINDITDLLPAIKELVEFVRDEDEEFTIRIHAGENDSLKDNVAKSIECVRKSLSKNQKFPNVRLGHGLYTADLESKEGKDLIKELKETNTILEFQLTSNVRLNNLSDLEVHPLKRYLEYGIKCVQGTDGCGFYGVDTIDEQLALKNLLNLTDKDFEKMREIEVQKIEHSNKYFENKSEKFNKYIGDKTIKEVLTKLEEHNVNIGKLNNKPMRITNELESEVIFKDKIKQFPINKKPIIIAGGSFNKKGRTTDITIKGKAMLEKLIEQLDEQKVYFVIGHKVEGYEKELIEISKKMNKKFEINAIIPKMISETESNKLKENNIDGVRVSIESDEMGIYKSFNYEIFERRDSLVMAFDGNSPVSNLVQEAKNGKGDSKIYINEESPVLKEKINTLGGYVVPFTLGESIVDKIIEENPELLHKKENNLYKKIEF